jgi:dTDP-4-amino-4,6-dideoxygalactose transaminase
MIDPLLSARPPDLKVSARLPSRGRAGGRRTVHDMPTTATVPFMDLARQHEPLTDELLGAFDRVLGSSAFILGEEVERFEVDFARYCGVDQCVGVASGTAALTIILKAAGIGPGDDVIVPAHTFIATALAVIHAGATPVCVDVQRGTGLIDPVAVRAAIGPRTAAILPVHLYGQTCRMDELRGLAESHGLAMFEDAAQAHGATHRGQRAGSLARAAAFSFYPSKNLGALGDAGAICTDDGDLAASARRLRDLGRLKDRAHMVAGYNERMDGVQAALLRVKLPHLDSWNAARRAAAARYREQLGGAVELLAEHDDSPCVHHLFPVRVDDRDTVVRHLSSQGIACGIHYPLALPDQPSLRGLQPTDAPLARDWAAREVSLPMFAGISDHEVTKVTSALRSVVRTDGSREGVDG